MTEPAAIPATFAGFKQPVIGRRVVPLVFEVPIEEFQAALKALGTPDAASPIWCAIARLNSDAKLNAGTGGDGATREDASTGSAAQPAERASPSPTHKPNSTRAVMMAKDPEFQKFARTVDAKDAEAYIKTCCRVESKSELNMDPGALAFDALRQNFYLWRRDR